MNNHATPPRLRRPEETAEQYRIAMGWDRPTSVAMPATEADAMVANERTHRTPRERIAAGDSPFLVHAEKVLGCYSTAFRLQALVLSLYNSRDWAKKVPVRLDDLLAGADDAHVDAAIDMMRGYARHGENDPDFLALGRQIALRHLPKGKKA